jgi:hypothetical protein
MYSICIGVIFAAIFLTSCGKKGPVEPLETSNYPRTYPKPPDSDGQQKQKPKVGNN